MLNKNRKQGFTLIELLVVIAIIGMLAATVLVSLGTARAKGRDAKRIADLKNIELAMQLYADSNQGRVPLTLNDLSPNYIKTLPIDPNTGAAYGYVAYGKVAGSNPEKCLKYHLGVALENQTTVLDSDADLGTAAQVNPCTGSTPFDGADGTGSATCGMSNTTGYCYDLTN